MRGIWTDYSPEPCELDIRRTVKPPKPTSAEQFQKSAYSNNDMWSKTSEGEINMERTIAMRKGHLERARLPETSELYLKGFGIFYDNNGLPWYGKLPKTRKS